MRIVAALLAGMAFSLGALATVFAHAEPATAKPGDGAVLNQAPGEIVLVMSQEMVIREGANDIDVLDLNGQEVTTIAATVDRADRKKLSVALPSSLATGKYTVKWKTVSSEDGDSDDGELSFTLDPAAQPNTGIEELRPDLLNPGGAETVEPGTAPSLSADAADSGVTWVLVAAVGIGMFVLGAGGTFLLVQRKA
jgi:methionine-rich copper-binding protein CopC